MRSSFRLSSLVRRTSPLLLAAVVAGFVTPCLLAQDTPSKPAAEAKGEALKLAGGKVVVEKPASWKTVPPKSNIIEYEFRAPAEGEDTSRVTIMSASGGI